MPSASISITTAQVTTVSGTPQLAIGWTQTGCAPPYQVTVKNETDTSQPDQTFSEAGWTGFPPETCTPVTFTAGDSYSVTVSQLSGGSPIVTSAKVDLLTEVPAPTALVYDGSQVTATWNAVSGTAQYTLFKGVFGQTAQGVNVDGSLTTYAVTWSLTDGPSPPQGEPSPFYMYIHAAGTGGTATSASKNYYLLDELPAPSQLSYDGTDLSAAWSAVTGATNYAVDYGEADKPQTTITTPDTNKTFPWTISGGGSGGHPSNYIVQIAALYDTVVSAVSPQYYMIAESPQVTAFQNDGTDFEVTWTLVDDTGGTQIVLTSLGTPYPTNVAAPATQKTIDRTPQSGSTLTARSYTNDGVVLGPASAALTPITEAGTITSVTTVNGGLEVDWDAFTGTPTVDGTQLSVSGQTPVSGPASGPHVFDVQIGGGADTVTLRGTSGSVLIGPAGPSVSPVMDTPSDVILLWNQTDFIVSWSPVADSAVTGYLVTLFINDAAQTPVAAASPPLNIPQASLADDTIYQVVVQAVSGIAKGPPSAKAAGPYKSSVTYTNDTQGRLIAEAWAPSSTISYTIDAAGNISAVTPAS